MQKVLEYEQHAAACRNKALGTATLRAAPTSARKERHPDVWDPPVAPYDPYGPVEPVTDDVVTDDGK
jgi:hypothetical protein